MEKKKFIILFSVVSMLFLSGLCTSQENTYSSKTKEYFLTIALGAEYGDKTQNIKKWVEGINILIQGESPKYLIYELNEIIKELNELNNNIKIKTTVYKKKANFILFFGSGIDYVREIEKSALSYIDDNWGLFWCYWNENFELYRASVCIDITKITGKDIGRHLLREELTQALGLMNDSPLYEDSIFYEGQTATTEYSQIDRDIIKILYNEKIKPGMMRDEVIKVLKDIF